MAVASVGNNFLRVGKFVNGVMFGKGNLLLTNSLISTGMGALGDFIQQHYDIATESAMCKKSEGVKTKEPVKYDWIRTGHMSAAGFTTGLVTHYWYILLDKKLGNVRRLGLVTKKVLLDQIFFSPVNLAVYFSTVGVCERSSIKRVFQEIKEKGMENIYVVEWMIWPPAQYFNFLVLPLRYRILFDNVISLGFDIYSPYVKYKTELKSEKEKKSQIEFQTQ
jgi:protein Mpv17